jgi:hypothetical protein
MLTVISGCMLTATRASYFQHSLHLLLLLLLFGCC